MKEKAVDAVGLYYYDYPNVGDALNKTIFKELFGIQVTHKEVDAAEVVAIGSLLDMFLEREQEALPDEAEQEFKRSSVRVWGTGLMYEHPDEKKRFICPLDIYALRGELTRKKLSVWLGRNIECVLADPGLLASLLVAPQRKKYEIGIIPHYIDAHEDVFQKMLEYYPNSVLIDVQADPIAVLETISQCKHIVSTSLHGLILADSFGIPNLWCECSDRVLGSGHKFRDYYSSYGLEAVSYDLRAGEFPPMEQIRDQYRVSYRDVCRKQRQLLASRPYAVKSPLKLLCLYLKCFYRRYFKKTLAVLQDIKNHGVDN